MEGIFRISASHKDVKDYKDMFERGEDVNLETVTDPHVVANLIKVFFRELPEPLMTFDLYDCFLSAIGTPFLFILFGQSQTTPSSLCLFVSINVMNSVAV